VQHVEGNLSAAAGTCTLRPNTRKLLITCNRSSVSFRCKSLLFHVVSAKLCDNVLRIFHSEISPVPAGRFFRSSSPVVNRRELRFSLKRLLSSLQSQGTTVR
jgi:hypothetical protein